MNTLTPLSVSFVKTIKYPVQVLNQVRLAVRGLWLVNGVKILATSKEMAIQQYNKL